MNFIRYLLDRTFSSKHDAFDALVLAAISVATLAAVIGLLVIMILEPVGLQFKSVGEWTYVTLMSLFMSATYVCAYLIIVGVPAFLIARKSNVQITKTNSLIFGTGTGLLWCGLVSLYLGLRTFDLASDWNFMAVHAVAGITGGYLFWRFHENYSSA